MARNPRAARPTPPQPARAGSTLPMRRTPAGRYDRGPSRAARVLLWIAAAWAGLLAIALVAVVVADLRGLSVIVVIAAGLGVGGLCALANQLVRAARRTGA